MAEILFPRSPCDQNYSQQECLSSKTRLSIFLITEMCVGVPAIFWALRVLYGHQKSGNQVSAFMISLLLSDQLVLLLNPYIVAELLRDDECWDRNMTCHVFSSLWAGSLIYEVHFQQVVALEAALSFRHSYCSAHAFFPSCSIIISIIVFICFFLCELFRVTSVIQVSLPLLLIIILTLWIITWRAPPHISNTPYRSIKPSFTVFAFVTFTVILYVSFISMYFIRSRYWNLFVMCVSLMSLNVIIDPLLCVFICRKHTENNRSVVNIVMEN